MEDWLEGITGGSHDRSEVAVVAGVVVAGVWAGATGAVGTSRALSLAPLFVAFGAGMLVYGVDFMGTARDPGANPDGSADDAGAGHGRTVRRAGYGLVSVLFLTMGLGSVVMGALLALVALDVPLPS